MLYEIPVIIHHLFAIIEERNEGDYMKAKEIIAVMEKYYPLACQEDWDKCGLQAGDVEQDVHKLMIALDADIESLNEAIDEGCEMLITHHPFLFNELTLDMSSPVARFIETAMQHHIVIYSAHTSLDKISMNYWLMEKLGVMNVEDADETNISKKGILKDTMSLYDFLDFVKTSFGLEHIRYAGDKQEISSVAICGGSGGDMIDEIAPQVDAYITGDLKYHTGHKAKDYNVLLVDVGHHVEVIMVHKLKELIEKELEGVEILEGTSRNYYKRY